MSMRKQFVDSMTRLLKADERIVLLLGDIGVFGFRDAFAAHPDRVYNIGILEQSTVSVAAGLAQTGLIPVVHTIAPFLTERCFEQIKVDFGYQELSGVFVTVGASYDYAALGCTHHCPGDVQIMTSIPELQVMVPGSAGEFDALLASACGSGKANYIRLCEIENKETIASTIGRAEVVRQGNAATILAVGPMLAPVLEAAQGTDVTVLYYATVAPFDAATLRANAASGKVLLCEPYYRGGLSNAVTEALWPKPVLLRAVGVPHRFLRNYGKRSEHDAAIGFTPSDIRAELQRLIDA
jgi:transketolase